MRLRKFDIEKRIKANTTGKLTRAVKKEFVPYYGAKGKDWFEDPQRAVYNKTYHKTTTDGTGCGCLLILIIFLWLFKK